MGYTPIVEHERENGAHISVGQSSRGSDDRYMLVFDGFDGLETVIHFTEVVKGRNTYEFKSKKPLRGRYSRTVNTGSIEADDFGEVGEWLDDLATHD